MPAPSITVVAPALGDELTAALARGAFTHHAREFAAADIEGAWLVVAATDDRAVNAAVAAAANAARIPCNVVDDRELSSFIMPAIIDRSPVQIAVSTGGTSPVLARLIRERLETLLDGSLGPLAAFADRWRERVKAQVRGHRRAPPVSVVDAHRPRRRRAARRPHRAGRSSSRARRSKMPIRIPPGTSCWSAPVPAIPAS